MAENELEDKEVAWNRRVAVFASEIKAAYAAAGRPLSDDTVHQVAESLALAVPCGDSEIRAVFAEAKNTDDLPTQRALLAALGRIRQNARAREYLPPTGETVDARRFIRDNREDGKSLFEIAATRAARLTPKWRVQ